MTSVLRRPFAVLDGGLSTALESLGADTSGHLWTAGVVVTRPDLLVEAHRSFVAAGADVITTASYQCGVEQFAAAGLRPAEARRALVATTELARRATSGTRVAVAASLGPFGASRADGSEYDGRYAVPFDDVVRYHRDKVAVIVDSGPDVVAVETLPRADEAAAVAEILVAAGAPPAWFSFGCRDARTTYGGDDLAAAIDRVIDYPALVAIGVNCSAPHVVDGAIETLGAFRRGVPIVAYPNHGREWDSARARWTGDAHEYPEAQLVDRWIERGVGLVGGCCGVGPAGVRHLAAHRDRV